MILKDFIIYWNNKYPYDRLWREAHKVGFNSPQHREINPFTVVFEFKEKELFDTLYEEYSERKGKKEDFDKGVLLRERQYSKEEKIKAEKILDSLQLNQFDDIVSFE